MHKTFLLVFALVATVLQTWAQTSDPVIMTIAGRNISRSEFEYSLNKNAESPSAVSDKEISDYVDLFINYHLKVQAAKDARLDTLSSFQQEYRTYRDIQLRTFVYDSLFADSVAREVYKVMQQSVGDDDLVSVSHILLAVPQDSNTKFLEAQRQKADSLYQLLLAGADFKELACQYSDDRGSVEQGGQLPWIAPSQVIPEFRDAAWALKAGELSRPVLSPVGYHIILMHDRKKLEPYELKRKELIEALNERGLREDAAERMIERMQQEAGGQLSREQILLGIQQKAEREDATLKYLLAEYYDGLLLYEASNRMVWMEAAEDESGLQKFFKANKDKYQWSEPHMRGYVYRARSKAMLQKIQKALKKCKADEGLTKLRSLIPQDSMKFVKVHFGLYKQGDDQVADYVVFKTGKKPKENKVLPYYGTQGKILKQPADYIDVKAKVVSDYQDEMERTWVAKLRKKYKYYVDPSVLKTVNKH